MYSPNYDIKTYYFNAIKTALPTAAVFKNYVPKDLNTDNYFLISNVQNVDYPSINKHDVKAFVTVGIYTREISENTALTLEDMAAALFSIFPTPQSYPVISGYQVCSVTLESDNELTVNMDSGNIYINRQIVFSHILNKQ